MTGKKKILITGTGGTGVGASVLHALQQAGQWETFAVDAEPFSWGLYVADGHALVPFADDPGYLSRIRDLAEKNQIAAVIPGTEAETVLLANRRDELSCPVIANKARLMPFMRDKRHAQRELALMGLRYIPSYPWDRRHKALAEFGFPLVVKPMKDTSGSRGLHLVTTRDELEALIPFLHPDSDVQPYLGDADEEYAVSVLSGRDGEVFGSFVLRRKLTGFSLHTAREYQGRRIAVSTGFSQGYVIRHPQIQDYCEDLALRLGSTGPLNMQLRLHDRQPYLFEIQPRFTFSAAFRATAGFNEPHVLLRHWLYGEDPVRLRYRYQADVAVIRAFDHILVPVPFMEDADG